MPKADSPTGFKQLQDTALFTPFQLGPLQLEHRIVQAPLTRMRSTKESEGVTVPNDLNVEYFSQRASKGGLQLTEATDIAKFVSVWLSGLDLWLLTAPRLAATRAPQASSPTLRSQDGKRSQMLYMQRADTSSVNCGTLGVPLHHLSAVDSSLSARVTSQWRVAGQTAQFAQSTRRAL
jgi:hypothetical protein